jgi:hypothetical protein
MNLTIVSNVQTASTRRRSLLAASIVVALLAFGYRCTSLNGFSNDHFVHLARAQAMLAGDLPIRDYTEEGVPLTVLLSAGAQLVFGQSLFAELVLVVTSLSVAAGVTCWLASRVTGSLLLGMGAALLQVLVYPRLYSHPKILLYSVFLLIAWWYLTAPGRRRLGVLALWTAVSFLIRHDHGVYIGLGAAAVIAVAHWRDGIAPIARRGVEYGILTVLWLTPYLAYVQYQRGLVDYFRTGLAISGSEASRTRFGRLTFDAPPAGSWIAWPSEDPDSFAIRVRWTPDVDEARRRTLERDLGLLAPEHAEGRTWRYRLESPARATLAQLVSRAEAEDTSGFDRSSLTIDDERSLWARALSATRLDRLASVEAGTRLAGLFSAHNVSVVLFFAIWSLPIVAVVLLTLTRRVASDVHARAFTIVLSALVAISAAGLLRDSLAQRIPDMYGSLPMLVACVIAIGWRMRPSGQVARIAAGGTIVALATAFVLGTLVLGQAPSRLDQARILDGPRAFWQRAQTVFQHTREWPWATEWPAGNGWKVARYVHDCTGPDDRLLVTWSAPEMNVFSRRVFAGGETALLPIFRPPAQYEPSVVARLSRQSVPIVLVDPDGLEEFERLYPDIKRWLDDRFHRVGQFSPDDRPIDVYVDRNRTRTGTDAEFGWPCFASR